MDTLIQIIASVLIVAVIASLVGCFVWIIYDIIENANNAITSGIIVDKYMDSGGTHYHSSKDSGRLYSYPPSYYFTIRGAKDDKMVDYMFEVTAEEYSLYKIGDKYER